MNTSAEVIKQTSNAIPLIEVKNCTMEFPGQQLDNVNSL